MTFNANGTILHNGTQIAPSDNTPMWFVKLGSNFNHSSSNSWQNAPLSSEIFDTSNVFNTTNYKMTVPSGKAGKYFMYYQHHINDAIDQGENMQGKIQKNGSDLNQSYSIAFSTSSNKTTRLHHSFVETLAVGDEINMWLYQHEGGSVTYQAYATWFGGYRLAGT